MGWGRMDDRFDDHPKVLALLDEDDQLLAAAAIGLWSLCFAWAHRNTRKRGQVPGRVPAGLPRRYIGQHAKGAAALLVKHHLWETQDDGAWLFHDFNDYLPTEETRSARSEAGKRGAARRWAGHKAAGRDGNLPSDSHDPDGKADGKDMASDGSGMASDAEQAVADDGETGAPRNGVHITEGLFEPASETAGDDGNLPSGCHDGDSNAVASDGSRAPARRAISKEIATRTHSQSRTSSSSGIASDPDQESGAKPVRADVERLCKTLADWVVKNGSKRPVITKTWRDDARLLLDADRRPLDRALALIEWCQRDPFWRSNIQSMPKFRKQYDQLRLKANEEWEKAKANGGRVASLPADDSEYFTEIG